MFLNRGVCVNCPRITMLCGVLSGLLITTSAVAQRDFSVVEVVSHHVAGNVYYLEGAGGNIGVSIGDDGIVMIDDQFAPLTDKIVAAISELDDGEIRFVINTHLHGDHTGGNENLGKMGVLILARDEVRVRLSESAADDALPVLTFSESLTIHLNGEEVHAFAVSPAHTDGDSYVHFKNSNVIHAGDVFRTTGYPYIDTANGGTLAGLIEALETLIDLAQPDTKIVPGHGNVSDETAVMELREMVTDVAARVKPMVAGGMSYEQVVAAAPTADYDEKFGDPERFVRAVYSEVGGQL